ncbi:hypothetical protein G6F46_014485 [Rhizopus delemar]|nr:hypothetical protein G6F46_014485 [Rhizopus delemar]
MQALAEACRDEGWPAEIAAVSASAAWHTPGAMDARPLQAVLATASPERAAGGYAQRAAIAHAVPGHVADQAHGCADACAIADASGL